MDPETEGGSLEVDPSMGKSYDPKSSDQPNESTKNMHPVMYEGPSQQNSASGDSGIDVDDSHVTKGSRDYPNNIDVPQTRGRSRNRIQPSEKSSQRPAENPNRNQEDSRRGGDSRMQSRSKSRGHSYNPEYRQPVHIYEEKLNFKRNAKSRIQSLDNLSYTRPDESHFRVFSEKVDFRSQAKSKLDTHSSLSYRSERPLVVIYNEKLDFNKKAKPKISTFDNINFRPHKREIQIVNNPLKIEAKPKINSFENVHYSPRRIDLHIVNHQTDWFTPVKTSREKDFISYYPSINNSNPLPIPDKRNQIGRKTPRRADPCCENADEVYGTNYLTPRSRIRREKPKGYYMEPVHNNKKVHFINDDELADVHRQRFEQQTRNTRRQFQAIREENSQVSGSELDTPRDLKTRQGVNRLFASNDPFKESDKNQNQSPRMNKRDVLPGINQQNNANDSNNGSPQSTFRESQPEPHERIYDAQEEMSGKRLTPQFNQNENRNTEEADAEEFLKKQLIIMKNMDNQDQGSMNEPETLEKNESSEIMNEASEKEDDFVRKDNCNSNEGSWVNETSQRNSEVNEMRRDSEDKPASKTSSLNSVPDTGENQVDLNTRTTSDRHETEESLPYERANSTEMGEINYENVDVCGDKAETATAQVKSSENRDFDSVSQSSTFQPTVMKASASDDQQLTSVKNTSEKSDKEENEKLVDSNSDKSFDENNNVRANAETK